MISEILINVGSVILGNILFLWIIGIAVYSQKSRINDKVGEKVDQKVDEKKDEIMRSMFG